MNEEITTTTPVRLPPMPPEIAAAVVKVMSGIKRLEKEGTNTFQRYKYTSVDQFFEAVGPLMAEAQIFTLVLESSMEVDRRETIDERSGQPKVSMWMIATYDIYLYHATGTFFGPILRSIQVPASGAQSYASAMSFIEKYFLRSLFKIPTGDAEIDVEDRRDLPPRSSGRSPPRPTPATITQDQASTISDALKALGSSAWANFSAAWKISRLGELSANDYAAALAQLQARQAAMKATNGKAPPNPNHATTASPNPQQASVAFDWDGYRAALKAADTAETADAIFDEWVEKRRPHVSLEEEDEAQALLRECCDRFFIDGPSA